MFCMLQQDKWPARAVALVTVVMNSIARMCLLNGCGTFYKPKYMLLAAATACILKNILHVTFNLLPAV